MADARELIQRINDFQTALAAQRKDSLMAAAMGLKDMIQRRIQQKSEDSNGFPLLFYTVKYGEYREDNDRQAQRVTYTFTGDLWSDIKAIMVSETRDTIKINIAPTRADNIDKVKGAAHYRNERILTPSKEELEMVRKVNQLRAQRLAESFGIPFKIV